MRRTLILLFTTFLLSETVCPGQTSQEVNPTPSNIQSQVQKVIHSDSNRIAAYEVELEIDELLFDETITKAGSDFYHEFFTTWENPTQIKSFSIYVRERPMPGIGTQLRVFIDEQEVFSSFVQPKMEMIERMAEYANELCQRYLINYQEIQAQLNNEDQTGTGIY